ncbi:MAG: hypothetical protein CM15mP84_05280 [Cellvibrionales bacterium]|nr:MAG: hypothetical protein CM15mP84_05280 [Cellvibrionales bacterium]
MGIIDYKSPLSVLISVKGHPYERDPLPGCLNPRGHSPYLRRTARITAF